MTTMTTMTTEYYAALELHLDPDEWWVSNSGARLYADVNQLHQISVEWCNGQLRYRWDKRRYEDISIHYVSYHGLADLIWNLTQYGLPVIEPTGPGDCVV